MLKNIKNIKSKKSDLQKFGITIGIFLLFISGFLLIIDSESPLVFCAIGAILLLCAITIPNILKPIYLIWMIFAIILGWIMTQTILSLFFYIIVTPIGLTGRFLGKQFLELNWDKSKESYWNYRTPKQKKKEKYVRQF